MDKIKQMLSSKRFTNLLWSILILILALTVFKAGVLVGYRKAAFSYRWGESYYKTFKDPRKGHLPGFPREDFPSAHGVFGKIVKIENSRLVVDSADGVEKIVNVSTTTSIRRLDQTLRFSDLKNEDSVIIFGSPNDQSSIDARLIRIMK